MNARRYSPGLLAQFERGARLPEERPRLLAEFNGRLHVIDVTQVELIEADRNYVQIRVGRDTYHARSTLAQAELVLRSQPMLRISRSCLVNMNYLKEVNRTLRGDFILSARGWRDGDEQRRISRQGQGLPSAPCASPRFEEGFRAAPPVRRAPGGLSEKRCNRVVSGSRCQISGAEGSPLDHTM